MSRISDTPAARMMEFMKKHHPELYRRFVIRRPDLVRRAYEKPVNTMNGLGESDGLFDAILDFGTKSLNLYKDQQIFKQQMQQAKATPVMAIQQSPYSAQRVGVVRDTYVAEKAAPGYTRFIVPAMIGLAALVGFMFLRRKRG